MSFSSIAEGVVRTITTHADYSCNNVYYADSRHLGAGQQRYVVVSGGGIGREEITFRAVRHDWNVVLDVYSRYSGELKTTSTGAYGDAQNIIDTLESYPRLNDTTGVNNFTIASVTPIEPLDPSAGRNAHVKQQIVLLVEEVSCPTRNE